VGKPGSMGRTAESLGGVVAVETGGAAAAAPAGAGGDAEGLWEEGREEVEERGGSPEADGEAKSLPSPPGGERAGFLLERRCKVEGYT
jgi:hypothetical protein